MLAASLLTDGAQPVSLKHAVYIYLSDWLAVQKRRRDRTAALVTSVCRSSALWRQKKRRLSRDPLAQDKTACGRQGDTFFLKVGKAIFRSAGKVYVLLNKMWEKS